MLRRCIALLLLGSVGLTAASSSAQTPAPVDPVRFSFPGSVPAAGSARSAALALADRWLGEEPFSNPAMIRARGFALSPQLLHMSRQDLRSGNRDFDEQPAFFDAAGGWAALTAGPAELFLYAYQPVLRLEDNAYTLGTILSTGPSAIIRTNSTAREVRAGLGASFGVGPARLGVAGEWTRRDDHYELTEESGSPSSGTQTATFSGSGIGVQAGARVEGHLLRARRLAIGASLRYVPALSLDGDQRLDLLSGLTVAAITAERESGWEGGASVLAAVTESVGLLAAVGGRTTQAWQGFGVESGGGAEWKLAVEYRDPRDPWTARIGIGQEQQRGVPEPRAGVLGLGIGWTLEHTQLDLGVTHRTLARSGQPTSYDDRVVGTVTARY